MKGKRNDSRGAGALGTIIGLAILIVIVIAGLKIIPLHMAGNDVHDAMNEAANFGGMKPIEKLQYEIYKRAQDAGAPLPLSEIKIQRSAEKIVIQAQYQQQVDVLGMKYTYKFDKIVEKPIF